MKKTRSNILVVAGILIMSVFMTKYVTTASSNVPIMDYWGYLNALVEKSFSNSLSYDDLCGNNGIHRSPMQLFFFLCNVHLFHWNTQISMYLGIVVQGFSAILLYQQINNKNKDSKEIVFFALIIILVLYSLGNYELLAQEFAFSFSIRVFFFILLCIIFSNLLRNEFNYASFFIFFILLLLTVTGMAGAYGFGLIFSFILVVLFHFFMKFFKGEKLNIKQIICYSICLIFPIVLYSNGIDAGSTTVAQFDLYLFLKGLTIVAGTSLLGTYASTKMILIFGLVTLLIHSIALILYFMDKQYTKTYVPLLFFLYACAFYGMIFLGRSSTDLYYLGSPRYIGDALFAFYGDIMVFANYIYNLQNKSKGTFFDGKKFLVLLCCLIIVAGMIETDSNELSIAKYRKEYCDNLITMMENIDQYSDEELAPFQANSPDLVRNGIKIMQKYELGVFYAKKEGVLINDSI